MPLTIDEANTLAAAEQIANSLTGNNMNAPAAYIEPTVVNVTTTNTTTTTTTTAIATASTNSNFNSGNVYAGPGYVDQAANGPALGNDALVAIFTQCNQVHRHSHSFITFNT
jgi:hypothetical protein